MMARVFACLALIQASAFAWLPASGGARARTNLRTNLSPTDALELVDPAQADALTAMLYGVSVDNAIQHIAPRPASRQPPPGLELATHRWHARRTERKKIEVPRLIAFGAMCALCTRLLDVAPELPYVGVGALVWGVLLFEASEMREWAWQITELERKVARTRSQVAALDEQSRQIAAEHGAAATP